MLPSAMLSLLRQYIGQPDSANSVFTDAALMLLLQDGLEHVVTLLDEDPVYKGESTLATDQCEYNLPSRSFALREVYFEDTDGKLYSIPVLHSQDLLVSKVGKGWRSSDAGKPLYAYKAGFNTLGLYPKPSSDYNGNDLLIFYNRLPDTMTTTDTTGPSINDSLHKLIPIFAAHLAWLRMNDEKKATKYEALFDKRWNELKFFGRRFVSGMTWEWAE